MNRIVLILLVCCSTSTAQGQINDIESLMHRRILDCRDIAYNSSYLIPEFYTKGEMDSLHAVLEFWQQRCSISEPSFRVALLVSISESRFNENHYNEEILDYLRNYLNRPAVARYFSFNYNYWDYYVATAQLDTFTISLSNNLLSRSDLSETEQFILNIYANRTESLVDSILKPALNDTKIQEAFLQKREIVMNKTYYHQDLMAGCWIPEGNLSLVGVHPFLGYRGGFVKKRFTADITLGFRFLKSANTFLVFEMDSLWETNEYFGGYVGLDVGYNIFQIGDFKADLIGGIALDGFDALDIENPDENIDVQKSINTLNLNAGIGFKYMINSNAYIGADLKYNFLNYKNEFGTDLTGNAITLNLLLGGFLTDYDYDFYAR